MSRFLAIVWNERADHALADARALIEGVAARRPDWSRRMDRAGLVVFEAPHRTRADSGLNFSDASGVALGAVFEYGAERLAAERRLNMEAVLASGGAYLFSALWGRYVAFVKDEANACVHVARDPSGALGCFMARRGWAFAFFSDPDDVTALDLPALSTDWTYIAARLADNRVISRRTGCKEIEELPPGWIACVGQGRRCERAVWTTRRMAAREQRWRPSEAAEALRVSVERACRGWAACYDGAGLRLSGGLDSSIVAGCIAGRIGALSAINFVTPTPEGDERTYARAAARRAGLELREVVRNPARVQLAEAVTIAPGVRPPLWLADGETDAEEARYAREAQCQAIFAGRGGDNVFFRHEGVFALADRIRRVGMTSGLAGALWTHARAANRPLWRVAREALALAVGPPAQVTARAPPPFLSPRAQELLPEATLFASDLSPGKRLHLFMIEDRLNYFDARPHADYVYPLVSQPVLETCLAMPSYILSPAGADRGLARTAFADMIAPEILARRSKGQTTGYLAQILMRNLAFLRPFLLEGALAGAGMLDRDGLSGCLSEAGLMKQPQHMASLVGLLSVEAWLRARENASVHPAAVA